MRNIHFLAFILWLCALPGIAQTAQEPPQQPLAPPAGVDQQDTEKEHIVTKEEAKELFQSVDEILQFASKDTLLPMKHGVKKAMVSRSEVEKYIGSKFKDDADRKRFERSELVLKKFGLIPRTFDLHTFLIKLYGEQVAGYYDEKTKKINLLNWVSLDMQKPVMAHELTHALQDQSFDLEKMVKQDEEVEKRGLQDPNALVRIDEESTCRSAVMEGQAMIVLLDYIMAPSGKTVRTDPKFVDVMQSQMEKEGESPIFNSAPVLLKEELTFPYGPGMKFIRDLLVAGGPKLAFTEVLQRMPRTTREILEPREYLAGHVIPPLVLPDFNFLKNDYEPFDAGAIGEFDVQILLKQYAEEEVATRLSPAWRGGAYYAVGRKGAKPNDPNSTAHVGLVYVSKWADEASAKEFAKIYASALPQRYKELKRGQVDIPGRQKYLSADGPIFLQQQGNLLVIAESFDDNTADKLIQAAEQQTQVETHTAAKQ
jgi:hypothetical protein